MKAAAHDFWARAVDALRVAEHDLELSPDAAASRAYYAVFYAVSAHFALEGKSFAKHSAVEAAVHRDLVKAGRWGTDLGRGYSRLAQLRTRGDYGGGRHVSGNEGVEAIRTASRIMGKIAETHAEDFPFDPDVKSS